MLQSMGSQRIGRDLATEQQQRQLRMRGLLPADLCPRSRAPGALPGPPQLTARARGPPWCTEHLGTWTTAEAAHAAREPQSQASLGTREAAQPNQTSRCAERGRGQSARGHRSRAVRGPWSRAALSPEARRLHLSPPRRPRRLPRPAPALSLGGATVRLRPSRLPVSPRLRGPSPLPSGPG